MRPSCEKPNALLSASGVKACALRCPASTINLTAAPPELFYQLATSYLENEWPKIDATEEAKNSLLRSRLMNLSEGYNSIAKSCLPDFEDQFTQFAYIFCYLPPRAYVASRLCAEHPCIGETLSSPNISVTCFGSGPGSELLGLMATCKPPHEVRFHLVDLFASTWADWLLRPDMQRLLCEKLQTRKPVAIRRHDLDFLRIGETASAEYLESKLIIFSYIFSEFEREDRTAQAIKVFCRVLQNIGLGTTLLIVDNGSSLFFMDLLKEASRSGVELLVDASASRQFELTAQQKRAVHKAVEPWRKRIERFPQMAVKPGYVILRKEKST